MDQDVVLAVRPLGFPWQTADPFIACVHHRDAYPAGNDRLGPAASLAGRNLGKDFEGRGGWRMYHGTVVPGFPAHPHRGFETVTIVRQGFIDHSDSLGAAARYGRGDVQWLTAGRGTVHSEMFPILDPQGPNPLELFQIWLNLPHDAKLVEPHFAMFWRDSLAHHVVSGPAGATTDVTLPTDVVSEAGAGGPPAPGATRVVADDQAAWAVYDLGVTGNPALPAAVRVADDGTVTARAALPDRVGGARLEPQAVALGDGTLWIVGRNAVVGLDPATLAVRRSFAVQDGAPVELHGVAVAGGLLWSYDVQSGALLGIGPDAGSVRQRIALTEGAQTQFRAPATIIGGGDVLWVRVRVGNPSTLEQLITRVDARVTALLA